MDETTRRLVSAAAISAAHNANMIERTNEPIPGSWGEYYRSFQRECEQGQNACIMQEMSDTDPASELRGLIAESDPHIPGQAQARVAGYLHQYLRVPPPNLEDFLAGNRAYIDWIIAEGRGLLGNMQTEAGRAELDEKIRMAERTAAHELRALKNGGHSPQERLVELIGQAPDVFAHQAFPPELRLLASRALLRGEGSHGGYLAELALTRAEKRALLREDRFPLVDPDSGGVVAMTADSPKKIRMFLLTGREPGNIRQLTRELAWAAQQAELFSNLEAVVVPPGESPVTPELRARGSILTVVTAPGRAAKQPGWLASERDSFNFWRSSLHHPPTIMAHRGAVSDALDHGLLDRRPSGAGVILHTFGRSSAREPTLPDHVRHLSGPDRELRDLELAVPTGRFDEGAPPPAIVAALGLWPDAVLRPTSIGRGSRVAGDRLYDDMTFAQPPGARRQLPELLGRLTGGSGFPPRRSDKRHGR